MSKKKGDPQANRPLEQAPFEGQDPRVKELQLWIKALEKRVKELEGHRDSLWRVVGGLAGKRADGGPTPS